MNFEIASQYLLWSLIVNYAILLIWFVAVASSKNWVFTVHSKWFPMPRERYVEIHYFLMGIYKLGIISLNLVPYFVLQVIG